MAGALEADEILMNGLAMIFVLEVDDLLYLGTMHFPLIGQNRSQFIGNLA
jgi:hypothetical protein